MNNTRPAPRRFLALFPHPSTALTIGRYRQSLFLAGFVGAHAVPACILLAEVEKGLTRAELKEIAMQLKRARGETPYTLQLPSWQAARSSRPAEATAVLGAPLLSSPIWPVPQLDAAAGWHVLPAPGLILAARPGPGTELKALSLTVPHPFPLTFRASYVANLLLWPLEGGENCLSWAGEVGMPVWLPS